MANPPLSLEELLTDHRQEDVLPQSLNGWEVFLPLLQSQPGLSHRQDVAPSQPESLNGWEVFFPLLMLGPSHRREEFHPPSLGGKGHANRGLEGVVGRSSEDRGNWYEKRLNHTLGSSEEETQSQVQSPDNPPAPPPPDSPEQQSDFE